MTDAPKPPNRRRRKIIVAFVVLVLVSMVSWWFWPRGDARFVGTWRMKSRTREPICTVTLDRMGWMRQVGTSRSGVPNRYWIEGDHFFMTLSPFDAFQKSRPQGLSSAVASLFANLIGTDSDHRSDCFYFQSPDHFVVYTPVGEGFARPAYFFDRVPPLSLRRNAPGDPREAFAGGASSIGQWLHPAE